jgi:spore coat polysaccharide biosynthesis protein SpsF
LSHPFGIVIQARLGSTRLPGKVLKTVAGKSLIEHLLNRLTKQSFPICLAVPEAEIDRFLFLKTIFPISLVGGSETDVLSRFVKAAKENDFENVIRVTADNPFTSLTGIQLATDLFKKTQADYSTIKEMPYGTGVEVVKLSALGISMRESQDVFVHEHVTPFLYQNPQRFKLAYENAPADLRYPDVRLTVDTPEDFARCENILKNVEAPDGYPKLKDILAFLKS